MAEHIADLKEKHSFARVASVTSKMAILAPMLAKARWRASNLTLLAFVLSTLCLGLIASRSKNIEPRIETSGPVLRLGLNVESFYQSRPRPVPAAERGIHMLMPATKSGLNFCKTLLSLAILGYPKPQIIAWGDGDGEKDLLGGGSHFAKISRALNYLNDKERRKNPMFEEELIIMFDAYDVWFQLPYETLINRYEAIVKEENERVAQRMGRAHAIESISSPIVFAASKRCGPNEQHTIACYAAPESPLPADLYGGYTDTVLGSNWWSAFRTRYLVSGYIMGPVSKMRPLLERANEKLEECIHRNGAWWSIDGRADRCYHGSEQSIFNEIFGEQEFHREIMRRHHRTWMDDVKDLVVPGRPGAKPPKTNLMGAAFDDRLEPPFPHQAMSKVYRPGQPYDYGIAIDYWSLLGHQTSNTASDKRYIRRNEPLEKQIGAQKMFDCKVKGLPPLDLPVNGVILPKGQTWETLPLYTEVCVGSTPVMVHHNAADKTQLDRQWSRMWWSGHARDILQKRFDEGLPFLAEGIPTDTGETKTWAELCPKSFDEGLFVAPKPPKNYEWEAEQRIRKGHDEFMAILAQEEQRKQMLDGERMKLSGKDDQGLILNAKEHGANNKPEGYHTNGGKDQGQIQTDSKDANGQQGGMQQEAVPDVERPKTANEKVPNPAKDDKPKQDDTKQEPHTELNDTKPQGVAAEKQIGNAEDHPQVGKPQPSVPAKDNDSEKKDEPKKKPVEDKPVQEKMAQEHPVEVKSAQNKPAQNKPAQEKSAQEKSIQEHPAEGKLVGMEPVEDSNPNPSLSGKDAPAKQSDTEKEPPLAEDTRPSKAGETNVEPTEHNGALVRPQNKVVEIEPSVQNSRGQGLQVLPPKIAQNPQEEAFLQEIEQMTG